MGKLFVDQRNFLETISCILNLGDYPFEMIEEYHLNGKSGIKPRGNWISVPNGEVARGGYNVAHLGLNDSSRWINWNALHYL